MFFLSASIEPVATTNTLSCFYSMRGSLQLCVEIVKREYEELGDFVKHGRGGDNYHVGLHILNVNTKMNYKIAPYSLRSVNTDICLHNVGDFIMTEEQEFVFTVI